MQLRRIPVKQYKHRLISSHSNGSPHFPQELPLILIFHPLNMILDIGPMIQLGLIKRDALIDIRHGDLVCWVVELARLGEGARCGVAGVGEVVVYLAL